VQKLCFERDAAFDAEIREHFGAAVAGAETGGLQGWRETPEGSLALILLLDQMTRNIHRGTPQAFASDALALGVAEHAVAAGFDRHFTFPRRRFVYLPYEHSEDSAVQKRGLALFCAMVLESGPEHDAGAAEQLVYAARHAEIVFRFGRFPHRNAVLGRASTPEELAFLQEPMSSF
jgi:uncharacterized protein (DUF924 family)